jgi:hypothetical protein
LTKFTGFPACVPGIQTSTPSPNFIWLPLHKIASLGFSIIYQKFPRGVNKFELIAGVASDRAMLSYSHFTAHPFLDVRVSDPVTGSEFPWFYSYF